MELYKKVELKSLELYTEEHRGIKSYLMKAVYECISNTKKVELTIPRIDLCIDPHRLPNISSEITTFTNTSLSQNKFIDIFGSSLPLRHDKYGNVYYEKIIEEYSQKMTMEELEKKLGYKIELVSKK